MTATLEKANEALRSAVEERLASKPACCEGQPQHVTMGYDAATLKAAKDYMTMFNEAQQAECERLRGDSLLQSSVHPTSQAFFDLCDQLKEMHRKKSADYGCPSGEDPLANIRNGAKFVGIPSWKGAMVRLSDKVTRLAAFNATGRLENESLEDNLFDLASYSLLALLLHREERDG
jgi:hypothetical protein